MHRYTAIAATALLGLGTLAHADHVGPLVDPAWVTDHLDDANVILLDLRKAEDYAAGHIAGALSATYGKFGWRETIDEVPGMLPPLANINERIASLGITPASHVIVIPYGKTSSDVGSATRVYWTFKLLGHEEVSLLDGGMNAWEKAGNALSADAVTPTAAPTYPGVINDKLLVETGELLALINNEAVMPIDARIDEQWNGKTKHPKARIPGGIPTAKRLPQAELVDPETGKFVSPAKVKEVASNYGWTPDGDLPLVSYCNTGHWASTAWFALSEVAGISDVILYDGSMVAWTSDETNPLINSPNRLQQLVSKLVSGN